MGDTINQAEQVKSKYDSISKFYDLYELPMEVLFCKRWRELAISRLKKGKVLKSQRAQARICLFTASNLTS